MDETPSSRGNILIAYDNLEDLTVLLSMLANQGYSVRTARNGEMALSMIETAQPDLLLLDVDLPGMNALDVCRAIKQNPDTTDIPVICINTKVDFLAWRKAFEASASDYVTITRPFLFTSLIEYFEPHISFNKRRKEIVRLQNSELPDTAQRLFLELAIEREKLRHLQLSYIAFAHGMRGHLGNILGAAQAIQSHHSHRRVEEILPIIRRIEQYAIDSSDMLNHQLPFRIQSRSISSIHSDDIDSMIQNLIRTQDWMSGVGYKLQIEVQSTPHPFDIEADLNLLYWALKLIVDGMIINRNAITFRVYDMEDMAALEVEVRPAFEDDLPTIFIDPWAPTLVQNIVKLHNGRIEIEQLSTTSGIFRILLPLLRN